MRALLLLVGIFYHAFTLQAQNTESKTDEAFVHFQLDSLELTKDTVSSQRIITRVKEHIIQAPTFTLNSYLKLVAKRANNVESHKKDYIELLRVISSLYFKNGKTTEGIQEIETLIANTEKPISNLLAAISAEWKSINYDHAKNYPSAILYAKKSLQNYIEIDEVGSACNGFVFIAMLYGKDNHWKESISWHRKGLDYAIKNNNKVWQSLMSGNIGAALLHVGDTTQAIQYLNIDLRTGTELGLYSSVANTWILLSRIAHNKGQTLNRKAYLDSAAYYAQKAWPKGVKFEKTYTELYFYLANWYQEQGDYKNAYEYQKRYFTEKSGLDSIENRKYSSELLLKVEKNFQKKELDLLHSDIKQKASINRMYVFLISLLVLFLGLLIYFLLYQRKKTQLERVSNNRLEALNKLKDQMFSVISHDLRSPLASLSGLVELFNQPDLSEQEKSYLLDEIKNQLNATMTLLDNLLQWSMLQFKGDNQPKQTTLQVSSEINQLLPLLHGQAGKKHIQLKTNIPDALTVRVDPNHFQLIIRNLIGNAVKFSHPDQEILIQAEQSGSYACISVIDYGVGMPKEIVDSLFKKSTYHTTFGTGGEKGAGLGLNLCFEYANLNQGKLEVSSSVGKGSVFSLYLPIS